MNPDQGRTIGGCIIGFVLGVIATCVVVIILTHLSFTWR